MDTSVKASCNWTLAGGCDITKSIQTKVTHEDVFIKPELDEILSEDRAILLKQPIQNASTACEFHIRVFPRFKIESLTLVCSAAKSELFLGQQKEYTETVYGLAIEDDDDSNNSDQDMIRSYRYDIEINKSGITEIMLKLLSNSNEICIYGIVLNIAPNPNGITTLLPNAINVDNVQQMLNAEKCKLFMQMFKSTQNTRGTPSLSATNLNLSTLMEQMKHMKTSEAIASPESRTTEANIESSENLNNLPFDIRNYIDVRLANFEARISKQLESFEARQSAKLDCILKLLEKGE